MVASLALEVEAQESPVYLPKRMLPRQPKRSSVGERGQKTVRAYRRFDRMRDSRVRLAAV